MHLRVIKAGVDEDEALYTFQDKDILECEFYVVEALQFDLIIHHPFPALLQYVLWWIPRSLPGLSENTLVT